MKTLRLVLTAVTMLALARLGVAGEANDLRLVPFPKEVETQSDRFCLKGPLAIQAAGSVGALLAGQLRDEATKAGFDAPGFDPTDDAGLLLRICAASATKSLAGQAAAFSFREGAGDEDYQLRVDKDAVSVVGKGEAGLVHGVQTLRQLIRANRQGCAIPCVTIRDWPSVKWRAFQDDLTRGPSTRLYQLKRMLEIGSYLRMNLFTYYMEAQYAFSKHSKIGPEDGSLTPDDLGKLVAHGLPLHMDILGNQQSFGHFEDILKFDQYKALGEDGYVLSPVREGAYDLLDDMYSEVLPILPLPFFNVCCDETWGLGTGPSKSLAEEIGVGGVYVRHIRRVYDLIHGKYGKRMMMWGDIILNHADKLDQIPKDTIMLTWGYDGRDNFESQIVPFSKSGYDFFVCPGVNCWSRVLPHFVETRKNVQHFVRDGVKHGTIGMLNTAWDDDGENLNAPSWHGYAWGAECAWSGSATPYEDFNARLGAVLFGESGGRFGNAIDLLSDPLVCGMMNGQFWNLELGKREKPLDPAPARQAVALLDEAIGELKACQTEATENAELLDALILGAQRMRLVFQRQLDYLAISKAYAQARSEGGAHAVERIAEAEAIVRGVRDAHKALGKRFAELWLIENRPYALDWTMARYAVAQTAYDAVLQALDAARAAAEAGDPLPSLEQFGL